MPMNSTIALNFSDLSPTYFGIKKIKKIFFLTEQCTLTMHIHSNPLKDIHARTFVCIILFLFLILDNEIIVLKIVQHFYEFNLTMMSLMTLEFPPV